MEFRDRVDAHRAVILFAPMEGEMRFIALTARLDVRYDARNGGPVSPGKATMKASNARTAAGLRWEPRRPRLHSRRRRFRLPLRTAVSSSTTC
jgi:hypothetical protein